MHPNKFDSMWLALGEEHLQRISKILPDATDVFDHLFNVVLADLVNESTRRST